MYFLMKIDRSSTRLESLVAPVLADETEDPWMATVRRLKRELTRSMRRCSSERGEKRGRAMGMTGRAAGEIKRADCLSRRKGLRDHVLFSRGPHSLFFPPREQTVSRMLNSW